MLTRHANVLMSRLERVEDIGCAEIRKAELLLWYDRDRITKGVWADVHEKWTEVGGEVPLLVGDADGCWVLIYGKGLNVLKEAWLDDIRELGGLT